MKSTKELLEEEMKGSFEYTRTNFGQQVGDGYPEMVRDIVQSTEIGLELFLNLLTIGLAMQDKSFIKSLEAQKAAAKPNLAAIVLSNPEVFKGPLSMLYWGINIGRKLAQDEAAFLKSLEGDQNGTN